MPRSKSRVRAPPSKGRRRSHFARATEQVSSGAMPNTGSSYRAKVWVRVQQVAFCLTYGAGQIKSIGQHRRKRSRIWVSTKEHPYGQSRIGVLLGQGTMHSEQASVQQSEVRQARVGQSTSRRRSNFVEGRFFPLGSRISSAARAGADSCKGWGWSECPRTSVGAGCCTIPRSSLQGF